MTQRRPRRQGCKIPGCKREHAARGWCKPHWRRWHDYGDPLATPVQPARVPRTTHLAIQRQLIGKALEEHRTAQAAIARRDESILAAFEAGGTAEQIARGVGMSGRGVRDIVRRQTEAAT